jgi:hypothetical protein
MNDSTVDAKLKHLILLCKQTNNYNKLSVVTMTLCANKLNEVGIKLGMRPRKEQEGEALHEYLEHVNNAFKRAIEIAIFPREWVERLRKAEIIFINREGHLPLEIVRDVLSLYFDLRKMNVPNLNVPMSADAILDTVPVHTLAFGKGKEDRSGILLKTLIAEQVKIKQQSLTARLKQQFNPDALEEMITLKGLNNALEQGTGGKIRLRGTLKDNLDLLQPSSRLRVHIMITALIAFSVLFFLILVEVAWYPILMSQLNVLLLMFGGLAISCFLLVRKLQMKKSRRR